MADEKKSKLPKLPTKGGKRAPGRLTRRPLFWILLSIVIVTIVGQISSSGGQFTKVQTSDVMAAITRGDVEAAILESLHGAHDDFDPDGVERIDAVILGRASRSNRGDSEDAIVFGEKQQVLHEAPVARFEDVEGHHQTRHEHRREGKQGQGGGHVCSVNSAE